jgi:hypothetical protein
MLFLLLSVWILILSLVALCFLLKNSLWYPNEHTIRNRSPGVHAGASVTTAVESQARHPSCTPSLQANNIVISPTGPLSLLFKSFASQYPSHPIVWRHIFWDTHWVLSKRQINNVRWLWFKATWLSFVQFYICPACKSCLRFIPASNGCTVILETFVVLVDPMNQFYIGQ